MLKFSAPKSDFYFHPALLRQSQLMSSIDQFLCFQTDTPLTEFEPQRAARPHTKRQTELNVLQSDDQTGNQMQSSMGAAAVDDWTIRLNK